MEAVGKEEAAVMAMDGTAVAERTGRKAPAEV